MREQANHKYLTKDVFERRCDKCAATTTHVRYTYANGTAIAHCQPCQKIRIRPSTGRKRTNQSEKLVFETPKLRAYVQVPKAPDPTRSVEVRQAMDILLHPKDSTEYGLKVRFERVCTEVQFHTFKTAVQRAMKEEYKLTVRTKGEVRNGPAPDQERPRAAFFWIEQE